MKPLLAIVAIGTVAAIAYSSGKKKSKKSSGVTPQTAYGLKLASNCDVSIVDDGPALQLIDTVTAEIYPGMFSDLGPFAPAGGAQQVLATALQRAFPSCTWPPTRPSWRFKEGFKSADWPTLVAAWEAKFAERRGGA